MSRPRPGVLLTLLNEKHECPPTRNGKTNYLRYRLRNRYKRLKIGKAHGARFLFYLMFEIIRWLLNLVNALGIPE